MSEDTSDRRPRTGDTADIDLLTAHLDALAAAAGAAKAGADEAGTDEAGDAPGPGPAATDAERMVAELGRPSTWSAPPPGLGAAVLARVEAAAATDAAPPVPLPRPQRRAPGGRNPWLVRIPVAAAAAALIAVGAIATDRYLSSTKPGAVYTAAGTQLAPDATARLTIRATPPGFSFQFDAHGLPAAGPRSYYAAWLRAADGRMVPLGSFHERRAGTIRLWSGVDPAGYSTFVVTLQSVAAPPTPSGQVVLRASLTG